MVYSSWILLFLILKCNEVELSTPPITLTARYSSLNLVLLCELKHNAPIVGNVYLQCPFTDSRLCYANCKPSCLPQFDCLPMISSCEIHKTDVENFEIKWTIDVKRVNKSGNWQCSYRGQNSNSISLEKYIPKSGVSNFSKESEKLRVATKKVIATLPSQIDIEPSKDGESNLYYHNTHNDFWKFMTQPNIVLILICVFTISLLLNIIFLIRCALFRSVIENYLHAKKSPNSCLFRCFCIPVTQNLPTMNMKSMHQNNPPAYITYHRDEIYDDMSSGSQAERHLINNYSHYELDHDSILSRKVWSTDGSHSIINRPSNICPVQPAGNYVIVAGPVCTNRNHIVLNTPSNASLVSNSQHTYTTDAMGRSLSNEFQRSDCCTGSDNVIYSQPLKSRTRSFDPVLNDEISIRYMNNFKSVSPPPPPERNSNDQIHQTIHLAEPLQMKTVDLIEHYTNSTNNQTIEDTSS